MNTAIRAEVIEKVGIVYLDSMPLKGDVIRKNNVAYTIERVDKPSIDGPVTITIRKI